MKKNANCFICFILLFLAACSTEPIEIGPIHKTWKCHSDGLYYSDKAAYDFYCKEYEVPDSSDTNIRKENKNQIIEINKNEEK